MYSGLFFSFQSVEADPGPDGETGAAADTNKAVLKGDQNEEVKQAFFAKAFRHMSGIKTGPLQVHHTAPWSVVLPGRTKRRRETQACSRRSAVAWTCINYEGTPPPGLSFLTIRLHVKVRAFVREEEQDRVFLRPAAGL